MNDETPQKPETKRRDVYIKFYPSDWRGDEQLALCSLAARGLWVELMCLAHKAGGYVRVNGHAPELDELAKLVRSKRTEVGRLIAELTRNGVCSRAEDGALMSRRIKRDLERRQANTANGALGGNPKLVNRNAKDRLTLSGNPYSHSHSQSQKEDCSDLLRSAEPEPPPSPSLMEFETVGQPKRWVLTEAQAQKWKDAYPNVDIMAEAKRAKAYFEAKPHKRKTARGMPAFFVNWFNNTVNRGWGTTSTPSTTRSVSVPDAEQTRRKFLL